MERYIGHEPEVVERLQRILRNARDIKQVIQKVGQKMTPSQAHPAPCRSRKAALCRDAAFSWSMKTRPCAGGPRLVGTLWLRGGNGPDGEQAMFMVRNSGYDVVIADIRLPDMSGFQFMQKLQQVMDVEPLPLILMKPALGYDPDHSIVKAPGGAPGHLVQAVPPRSIAQHGRASRHVARPRRAAVTKGKGAPRSDS